MSKRGRPRKTNGALYKRDHSAYWWVRYPDQKGDIQKESSGTTDREEAERFLRARLDARDQGQLTTVLASRTLTFNNWADWFMERRSKPPLRAAKTHDANLNALKFLRPAFGSLRLSEITPEAIEGYLTDRLARRAESTRSWAWFTVGCLSPALCIRNSAFCAEF